MDIEYRMLKVLATPMSSRDDRQVTFNYFVVPDSRSGWWLVAGWVLAGSIGGIMSRQGSRESRTQIDR